MIFYKIAIDGTKVKNTPNEVVYKSTQYLNHILDEIGKDDAEEVAFLFYQFANFAKQVFATRNMLATTVEIARDAGDAYEYYIEVLKEASGAAQEYMNNKYGNLINENMMGQIATYASEEKKITRKKVRKHIAKMIPSPRKQKEV